MKNNQVNTIIGTIVILAILILLASYSSLFVMRGSNKEVHIFEVPEGVTVKWIAGRLEKEGIISNRTLFILAGRFLFSDKNVMAGE